MKKFHALLMATLMSIALTAPRIGRRRVRRICRDNATGEKLGDVEE